MNLLELAREFGVGQFVFGSSSSVYGESGAIPFAEEQKVAAPISPYAATKAAGELLCHTYAHLYDLRAICLRFFTVYGARQRPDLAIHKFSRLISEGRPLPVFGDGRTRRDYTFVDDIVAGVRAAIDYDKSNYEIFNLGESETIELNELIDRMRRTTDARRWLRLNDEFHLRLYECARRPHLSSLIDNLRDASTPYIYMFVASRKPSDQANEEHQEILDACIRGDSKAARRAIRDHLRHASGELAHQLSQRSDERPGDDPGTPGG